MRWFLTISSIYLVFGCASLERSQLDRELRIQGVFLCAPQAIPRPAAESLDTAVPRCSQDSAAVTEGKITWSRRYFVDTQCAGRVIGAIEWLTPFELEPTPSAMRTRIGYGPTESRRLIRADYNWFWDQPSACDLRQIPINIATPISAAGNCSQLFPSQGRQIAEFLSDGRRGASQLRLVDSRICRR